MKIKLQFIQLILLFFSLHCYAFDTSLSGNYSTECKNQDLNAFKSGGLFYLKFEENHQLTFNIETKGENGQFQSFPIGGNSLITYQIFGSTITISGAGGKKDIKLSDDGTIVLSGQVLVKMSDKEVQDCVDSLKSQSKVKPLKSTLLNDPKTILHGTLSLLAGKLDGPGVLDGKGTIARFGYSVKEMLMSPKGITSDSSGNLYLADVNNHTIRKISSEGLVTTLAGKPGTRGSADGIGSEAKFNFPSGIAVDQQNNLYVADTANFAIRKITSQGEVTTFAGKVGEAGWQDGAGKNARFNLPEGIVVNRKSGVIYVTDTGNNVVREISPQGLVSTFAGHNNKELTCVDGQGHTATFNRPEGITIDQSGMLYVADTGNNALRKITAQGDVSTLFGCSTNANVNDNNGPLNVARISDPNGMGIDRQGNLYVSTFRQLRKISTDGIVSTFAKKGGFSEQANSSDAAEKLDTPGGITSDENGNLFFAEGAKVSKISPNGTLTTIAGTTLNLGHVDGTKENATFNNPISMVAGHDGTIFVADTGNGVVRKISSTGNVTTLNARLQSPAHSKDIDSETINIKPTGIALDKANNVYISDIRNHVIAKINKNGTEAIVVGTVGDKGNRDGIGTIARLSQPVSMSFDHSGDLVFIDSSESFGNVERYFVRKMDKNRNVTSIPIDLDTDEYGRYAFLTTLIPNKAGNFYGIYGDTICEINPNGKVRTLGNFSEFIPIFLDVSVTYRPSGLAEDRLGNIYFSTHSTIYKIDQQGMLLAKIEIGNKNDPRLNSMRSFYINSMAFLDEKHLALLTNSAVLKLTLP